MKKISAIMFAALMLFTACFAAAEEAGTPVFATYGDAVAAAGEESMAGGGEDYIAVALEKDGKYIRVVSSLDERAKELDAAISEAEPENIDAAFEAFFSYVYTLPVSYTEEFTVMPKEQDELDTLAGKTISALQLEGYIIDSSGTGAEEDQVVFTMSYGIYRYDFVAHATFDEYQELQEKDELGSLTAESGRFAGFSVFSTDLRYHADGTVDPDEDLMADSYDLMIEIVDAVSAAWNDGDVDKEALIQSLTEKYPEEADMIREIVESYSVVFVETDNPALP